MASLAPHGLLTPKGHKIYNETYIKRYFVKLQTQFPQDLLLFGCDIFNQVMVICLHLIKHIELGFNTILAPPVYILKAKLWKTFIKCKFSIFFYFRAPFLKIYVLMLRCFISPCTDPINPNFAAVV